MNIYLVAPESMDLIDGCGTDMLCGHFDDLEVYQDERDADLAAYKHNKKWGKSPSKMVVIEMEVR